MGAEGRRDDKLTEYQVLSEDRRRAVEIFMKGFLVVVAVIAFGFKSVLDAADISSVVIFGAAGIVIAIVGHIWLFKCRRHDLAINERLNQIAQACDFRPVVSTQYIFNGAWIRGGIIGIVWIALVTLRIAEFVT